MSALSCSYDACERGKGWLHLACVCGGEKAAVLWGLQGVRGFVCSMYHCMKQCSAGCTERKLSQCSANLSDRAQPQASLTAARHQSSTAESGIRLDNTVRRPLCPRSRVCILAVAPATLCTKKR